MQRGVAKGLKVPCLFMITEVSICCQKKPPEVGIRRMVYGVYPPIHHCMLCIHMYALQSKICSDTMNVAAAQKINLSHSSIALCSN